MDYGKLPPIQRKIMDVLADWKRHTRKELHTCLYDEQGAGKNVHSHLTALRHTLRPKGLDVVCELEGRVFYYKLTRLTASPNDGRT